MITADSTKPRRRFLPSLGGVGGGSSDSTKPRKLHLPSLGGVGGGSSDSTKPRKLHLPSLGGVGGGYLWLLIGLISALAKLKHHNNFDIFRYVFYNTMDQTSLYAQSTDGAFFDSNHYGPFFAIIIAPFAVCPPWLGLILWDVCLAVFLYWSVSLLCRGMDRMKTFIIWFCAHELLTALFMQQFNVAIVAIIILSYYFVEKERDHYATFFIVIGTLVKLYGIVGIAFFFFSKHKVRYIVSLAAWSLILFALPMLISSPEYQLQEYQEWYTSLTGKNEENLLSMAQNISLLGIIRKVGYFISVGSTAFYGVMHDGLKPDAGNWWLKTFSDLWIILPAMLLMAVAYFRIPQWKNQYFRLQILAAVLMFITLFSTGSESSGYIIALIGCVIWYCCVPWQRTRWDIALMVFAFIVTSLSPSDLFPRALKHDIIQPFALKALPVTLIWLKMTYELLKNNYEGNPLDQSGSLPTGEGGGRGFVMLSFDTEEFDVPREHGVDYDTLKEGMEVSRYGTNQILDCLKETGVRATFFCTTNFATHAPEVMQRIINEGHEVAAHGCDHWNPKPEDVGNSKRILEELTGVTIKGYRQPRMFKVDKEEQSRQGYKYNASLNPAFIPGRYMHLTTPRTWFHESGVMQIPASVSPWFRIPMFWLSLHNFPMWLYKALCHRIIKHDGYFNTYFHPWEFYPLGEHPELKMPYIIRHNAGRNMYNRLKEIILDLKSRNCDFITYAEFEESHRQ